MNSTNAKFVIVAENLRIGGIQRLLIDEAYQFMEWNNNPQIISLAPKHSGDYLPDLDRDYPKSMNLQITHLEASKIRQIKFLIDYVRKKDAPRIFVTHSTTGAALIRIASILSVRKVLIILQIHQLISLSDKTQQSKRFIYSMFANHILFSSKQFLLEWNLLLKKRQILNSLYRKDLRFDRMGVYIPRLKSLDFVKQKVCESELPHLIYLSRVTSWKGFERFKEITMEFGTKGVHTLAITASNYRPDIFDPDDFKTDISHVILNLSVTSLRISEGSVHLYPSHYGPIVKYPQSIGMNVLEMITQGIPSLISFEGFESWPELKNSMLVKVVDWSNIEEVKRNVNELMLLPTESRNREMEKLMQVVSIKEHCSRLVKLMQDFSLQ